MPGTPRVIGPNANVPDAVDVEGVSGEIVTVPRRSLPIFGLAFEEGDAAVQAMQPAPEPIAQAPTQQAAIDAVPDIPLAPIPGAAQVAAAAPAPQPTQAPAGGTAPTTADLAPMAAAQQSISEQQRLAQERAQQEADIAQRQSRLNLVAAAMEGDPRAVTQIVDSGDPELARMLARAQALGVGQGGGGGGGQRMRQTTTFEGPGRPMTPEEEMRSMALAQSQREGEERSVDATVRAMKREADLARDTAEAMRKVEEDLAIEEQRNQQAERARRGELDRRQRELDRAVAEVSSRQIDPGRLYGRGETGARLTAAIGFFLGGLAEAFGAEGATQQVLGIINRAIDRDIEAQRGNISAGQASVQARRGLLQDMRARFGDEKAAEGATRAAMLADAERQLQRLRQSATSDAQRAQIDRMLGELQAQRAQAGQAALISGLGTTTTTLERRAGGGGGGGRRQIDAAALVRAAEADPAPITPDERRTLEGEQADAETRLEQIQRTIRAVEAAPNVFGPQLDRRAVRLAIDPTSITAALAGTSAIEGGDPARRALALVGQLAATDVRELAGPGAVTDSEREAFKPLTQMSENNNPEEVLSALRTAESEALRQLERARRRASDAALSESRARRPAVARQTAIDEGRAEDVVSSFRED